ncbi:hypothetical protein GOBAR_AA22063 [Gossypium barbadense]|uniref:Transposase MuDR plant domain-containing protein n=1 Tax=Gossypium barbadense TaxID=3634 RepID=A0A2P5X5M6_GOSBA|nr:hypothetical protein GOBAR_AA22063 [Gossypium barbadense]
MFDQALDIPIESDGGDLGGIIGYSIDDSDSEEVNISTKKWLEFNSVVDMDHPIFSIGMLLPDKKQLKATREDRVNVILKKDGKLRVRVVCKDACGWTLYGRKFTKDRNHPTFQIRTYKSKHTCCKDYANRNMDYKWLCNKYMNLFF